MLKHTLYSNENKLLALIKKNLSVFCDTKFHSFIFLDIYLAKTVSRKLNHYCLSSFRLDVPLIVE